jgi:integrase
VANQIIGDVRVYSRHHKECRRKDEPSYLKCDCVKWMQYTVDGKTLRESANTRSLAGLKLAAERKTKELRGEAPALQESTKTVEAAVTEWLDFRAQNGVGNKKAARLGEKLVAWCKENRVPYLHQVTTEHTTQFRNSLPYRTATSSSLKVHWSSIHAFFGWCHAMKLIRDNPVPDPQVFPQFRIKFKKPEVRVPTAQEVKRAITAVDKTDWDETRKLRVRTLEELMSHSGMAITDAVTLERERLNDDDRIVSHRQKTKERFKVKIPAGLAERLRALPPSNARYFFWDGDTTKPTSIVTYYHAWLAEAFELAGVQMTPHSFRHFFITQQLANGHGVDDVSKMVGTSPSEIRRTYWHWIQEDDERIDARQSAIWRNQGLDENGNQPLKRPRRVQPINLRFPKTPRRPSRFHG